MNQLTGILINPLDHATIGRIVAPLLARSKMRMRLFGSRARGDARAASDIDLALDAGQPIPAVDLARLREALEASNIPFRVDVVDYSVAPAGLRDSIDREGIPWPA